MLYNFFVKPLILLGVCLLTVMVITVVLWLTYLDSEWQDYRVLGYMRNVTHQLYKYKLIEHHVPTTLEDANINSQYCIHFLRCFQIKYKPSVDKQYFTIAAKVSYPFIAFTNPNCIDNENMSRLCGSLAVSPDYPHPSGEYPVYLKDVYPFATSSALPSYQEF